MTENEAIKVIRDKACNDRCKEIHCDDSCMYGKDRCAFHMAIQALEEIQAYRAIGTVEELQALKIENAELHCELQATYATLNLLLQEAREKAIDECIKVIEETVWRDTDMLVENIRELKGGAE